MITVQCDNYYDRIGYVQWTAFEHQLTH